MAIGDSSADERPRVSAGCFAGVDPRAGGRATAATTPGASEPESAPVMMQALFHAEYREVFLEIHQTDPERRLVTGIELLSPSNKRRGTKGWHLYHRKRQVYLRGLAHFVELDLLRRGRRMPMAGHWPDSPYYLLVCRKQEAPRCTVWPAHFLRPLPPLSIPLAAPDPDITLPSSRSSKRSMLVRITIATSTIAGRSIHRFAPPTPRGSRRSWRNSASQRDRRVHFSGPLRTPLSQQTLE